MNCLIKDIHLHYKIHGEGTPIIFLHGYFQDHRTMVGCMEPIFEKSNFKRIYIDLPGMGDSTSSNVIQNSDDMLDILITAIEQIIPNQHFLLAGLSYGGYLARGIVYKRPELVDGLLLLCPVVVPDSSKRLVPPPTVLATDSELISLLTSDKQYSVFASDFVLQTQAMFDRYCEEVLVGSQTVSIEFLSRLQQAGYAFSFDTQMIGNPYLQPTLILLGKQDSRVGYEDALVLLKDYPHATLAILDQAGHYLPFEQSDLLATLVSDWIKRITKGLALL